MRTAIFVAFVAAVVCVGAALAQEHPKEHPGDKKGAAAVSKEALGEAIREYVKKDAALKGGHFLVYDTAAKKPLLLTLVQVHDDKLARVADDKHFACADFKEAGGATYDLDIFMSGKTADALTPTKISIHKENGQERYGWVEEGGMWKQVPKK